MSETTETIVLAAIFLLFIGLACMFFRGRGSLFITGYNTMSTAKKEKVDKEGLFRFMGKCMLVLALAVAIQYAYLQLELLVLTILSVVLLVGTALYLVIRVRRHYLAPARDVEDEKDKKAKKNPNPYWLAKQNKK